MTSLELTLAYYALFETYNVSPHEILRRLEEVYPEFQKENVINQLVADEKLQRGQYNYKYGEHIYTITPRVMAPIIVDLFCTENGHRILDTLKPLYINYDMNQGMLQMIITDYVRSRFKDTLHAHNIYRSDIPYFIQMVDDERFIPLMLAMTEGTFVCLIKQAIEEAYDLRLRLNLDVIMTVVDKYSYSEMVDKYNAFAAIDLYAFFEYGTIDNTRKHFARIPETHLLRAVYETFSGNYDTALQCFREAQSLYNAKTSIIEMRGIFPQAIMNTLYTLTLAHKGDEESMHLLDIMIKRKDVKAIQIAKIISKILRHAEVRQIDEQMRMLYVEGTPLTKYWIRMLQDYMHQRKQDNLDRPEQRLLFSVYRQAPWETTIEALMGKLNKPLSEQRQPEKKERLAYYIDNIHETLVTPRLQTKTKTGAWSVGKTLPFHQYMDLTTRLLTPGDMLIRERNQNIGYVNNYKLTLASVLPEMTETSRLFVGKYSPYVLVTVTEDIPYLIIDRVDGGFEVKSNVRKEDVDENIIITSKGASSINFLKMTEEIRPFFAHLLSMEFFPMEAEEKLKVFLESLGKKVEIHSPLIEGGTTLDTIDGSSKLTLQMRPKGKEAYVCTVFCRPMEGGRVQCQPGEGIDTIIDIGPNARVCVKRNLEKEREMLKILHDNVPDMPTELEFETDAYGLLPILDYIRENQDEITAEWPEGQKLRIRHFATKSQWRAQLKKNDNGWFELEGQLQIDDNTFLTMQQLMGLLNNNNSRFIKLSDGEFMALSDTLRRQLAHIDALATRNRGHLQMSKFTAALLDNNITNGEMIIETDNELKAVRQRIMRLSTYRPAVPDTLNATLRGYQREGYEWISRLNEWGAGALLADDMGLGKTVQTIAYLLAKAHEGPQLVVAPASVAPNWMKELEKFAPTLNINMLNFAPNRSLTIARAAAGDVIVMTYTLLLSVRQEITSKEWVTAVLDEAHVIKNRGAKTSGVCMKLKAKNRVMLTGTPVQNHLGELWNLFQFVNPGLLGSYEDYGRRFITPIEVGNDKNRKAELERMVKPFMLRRTKEAVLDELPDKTEIYQTVQLTDDEMAMYEVMRRKAEDLLLADRKEEKISFNTLAEITKLRQAACSPKILDRHWHGKSSKIEAIVEALEPIVESGDAALVFSQFTSFLTLVKEALDRENIPYLYIDGSVPVRERILMVEKFQNNLCPVFLISLKAGGLGLNLTRANYVFHLDPWWNPAIEQQATDRAHRIGQQRAVTVYHMLAANTIEEKIKRMHERKRDLAESILEGTDVSSKMTGEELLELVSKDSTT